MSGPSRLCIPIFKGIQNFTKMLESAVLMGIDGSFGLVCI